MDNATQPQIAGRAAFSISEVLALTGLGRDKLYKMINSRQLLARKCGRRTIILQSDLERFLEELPAIGQQAA